MVYNVWVCLCVTVCYCNWGGVCVCVCECEGVRVWVFVHVNSEICCGEEHFIHRILSIYPNKHYQTDLGIGSLSQIYIFINVILPGVV